MPAERLRIAQLANFIGPVSGGMRTAVDQLGRGYVAAGMERILVLPGASDSVSEDESGITVRVRAPRLAGGYRMISQPWRALDVLDQFHPTTVESSDKWTLSPVARWARRRGIGSALFSHERLDAMLSLLLKRRTVGVPGVERMNRRLGRAFDRVLVTSRFAEAEWAATGARLQLVPLGVDLATFNSSRGAPVDDGVLKLIYVGRMSREKSPHLAVQTALELDRRGVSVRLDMYGTGPHIKELRATAGNGPIKFHGFVESRVTIAERLAAADIALSVCPAETFGLAVLEALACGTPVVTSDEGGAFELIDTRCGAYGRPNPEALADAVLRLRATPQLQVRAAARRRAQGFSWQHCVDAMLSMHADLAFEVPRRALR